MLSGGLGVSTGSRLTTSTGSSVWLICDENGIGLDNREVCFPFVTLRAAADEQGGVDYQEVVIKFKQQH